MRAHTNVDDEINLLDVAKIENPGFHFHLTISKRRVVVHICSWSLTAAQREAIHDLHLHENAQLTRLASALDPLVDVVYVSPVPLHEDVVWLNRIHYH